MERLAKLRIEKGLTQTALGIKLNVTPNMVSFYESGKSQPGIDTLIDLSEIFGVSIDYLVGNSDIRYKAESIVKDNSRTETEMLELFKTLTKDEQQRAIGIIQAIKQMSDNKD